MRILSAIHDLPGLVYASAVVAIGTFGGAAAATAAKPKLPAVGEKASDFELVGVDGKPVKLSRLTQQGPVVVIVLRGFPGYQCPICSRQVGEFMAASSKLRDAGATVVMIYPGPAERLRERAEEFITDETLPEGFHLLVDPDYVFTNAYDLRWGAPRETAYPATFVMDRDGTVIYSKVSQSHGDRASAAEVIEALEKASSPATDDSGDAAAVLDRVRQHSFHPVDDGFTKDATLGRHGIADPGDDDWRVRTLAIRDLARIGAAAVPSLLAGLEDDDLHVRHVSALVLGILPVRDEFAESVSDRVRALQARLESDREPIVRSEASIALGQLGEESSVALLERIAESDKSRDVRHQSALAIDRIGKQATDDSVFEAYRAMDQSTFEAISVGEAAVDFALQSTEGHPWKLSDFRGKKHVMLIWIFADWCPVCHGEFRDLVEMEDQFAESDVAVATIQCHDLYRSRVMVGKELLPQYWFAEQAPQAAYPQAMWWSHLSDPAGAIGAMYGVSPLAYAVHSEYVNRPATVIIDKEGIVRFAYYGTYWGDRPTIEQALEMIRTGNFDFEHPKRLKAKQ